MIPGATPARATRAARSEAFAKGTCQSLRVAATAAVAAAPRAARAALRLAATPVHSAGKGEKRGEAAAEEEHPQLMEVVPPNCRRRPSDGVNRMATGSRVRIQREAEWREAAWGRGGRIVRRLRLRPMWSGIPRAQ